jgi:uncharacterized protein YggE
MQKKNLIVLLSFMLLALLSACSPAASDSQETAAISVSGNGQVYITPDIAYINIGVHSEAPVVTDALDENNRQAQAVSNILQELGVAAEDIQTTAFNVYPMQEYGPMGEAMNTTYAVDNTVLITVRDLANLGAMLDAVVQAGANNIHSIVFDAQNKEQAYTEARKMAVDDARKQAEELAAAAGVKVGKVIGISAYSGGPLPAYEAKVYSGQGGNQVPVAAGQIVITIDANVTFAIE